MKQLSISLTVLAIVLYLGAPAALAQRGHGGGMGNGAGMGAPAGSIGEQGNHGAWGRNDGSPTVDHGRNDRNGDNQNVGTNRRREERNESVSDRLAEHPRLSSRLASELPPNTNLQQAAKGFKNMGQFVAAVHVSRNLGIPFDTLKSKMVGPPSVSLGKAIHELDPNANAKAEAKKAEKQAHHDLEQSEASGDNS